MKAQATSDSMPDAVGLEQSQPGAQTLPDPKARVLRCGWELHHLHVTLFLPGLSRSPTAILKV